MVRITVQIDAERIALLRELLTAHGWPVRTTPVAMLQGGLRALEQIYGEDRLGTGVERRILTHHARTAAPPEGDKGDKGDTHHVGGLPE